jgi:HSP20 family molecular chaperone IbpA
MQMEVEKHVITLRVFEHFEEGEGDSGGESGVAITRHRTACSRVCRIKRSIMLPESADATSNKVEYIHGVLSIRFPKKVPVDTATQLSEA